MYFDREEIKTGGIGIAVGLLMITLCCGVASAIPVDSTEVWGHEDSSDVQWKFVYTDSSVDHVVCAILPDGLSGTVYIETMNTYHDYEWKSVDMVDVQAVYELDKVHDWVEIWHN